MKFLSCYIAGFGKFIDCSFDFSADLVVIKEDNGWGKTTLAAFLKCMLYGMDGGRSKSLENNERAKYLPWKTSAFGGSLTFSYRGNVYRIERTFGKTAAGDDVRVYDQNNMPCYLFGDKPTRLGELLFGIDAESYERSVYIPQGEVPTGVLPDTMKNRLLALLGNTSTGEGTGKALEILENAERALRAKRRPAKGKLDVIDERLAQIAQEKADSQNFALMAKQAQEEIDALDEKIRFLQQKIEEYSQVLTQAESEQQAQAKAAYLQQIRLKLSSAQTNMSALQTFFNGVEPHTVQIDSIGAAITQLYQWKEEIEGLERNLHKTELVLQEKSALESKKESLEKMLRSYRLVLDKTEQTRGAGMRAMQTWQWLMVALGVLMLALGGAFCFANAVLGGGAMVLGVVLAVIGFAVRVKDKTELPQSKEEVARAYRETEGEWAQTQQALNGYLADLSQQTEQLRAQQKQLCERINGLEEKLKALFQRFPALEGYDYRVAFSTLNEKMNAYQNVKTEIESQNRALQEAEHAQFAITQTALDPQLETIRMQRGGMESELQEISVYRARLIAKQENYESHDVGLLLNGEETQLTEEKERLEKRLFAVRAAKDFLMRAQENLATRYLDPVTKYCSGYLQTMGAGMRSIRFSAEGEPLFEEDGAIRETAYYSAGMQGLVGFCTRIALAETVFAQEKPCLILDDPFTDFDDEKTEKAKQLVRSLSNRYQILYFTCKKERKI